MASNSGSCFGSLTGVPIGVRSSSMRSRLSIPRRPRPSPVAGGVGVMAGETLSGFFERGLSVSSLIVGLFFRFRATGSVGVVPVC